MQNVPANVDVLIIGAGPAGSVAATLLSKQGYKVAILEKSRFPRFSIGESLLPQCMEFLQEAGMLDAIAAHGFQRKNGAAFRLADQQAVFDFADQITAGWSQTYQVQRADFDQLLANCAADKGVPIFYEHEVSHFQHNGTSNTVSYHTASGTSSIIEAKFVMDASGFGRVLPKLLNLESPSDFPVRKAVFTHIKDNIDCAQYDRNKILVYINPRHNDVWYWLIPFANGTASLGVVGEPDYINRAHGDNLHKLKSLVAEDPALSQLLKNAEFHSQVGDITGYAANVDKLHGPGYALLGNAGEFLDPIFSSGVTIAMKSASLASQLITKQLRGGTVNWADDYDQHLRLGISTFRHFVNAWYDGSFQDMVFGMDDNDDIRKMICSILAGYAWDKNNPYVSVSNRRLQVLTELCQIAV